MNPTPSQQAASAAATPKTTTIERIARAICTHVIEIENPALAPDHVQLWAEREWPDYVGDAQAALQALRQVDEGTVEAMAKRQFRSVYGSEWSWEFAPESTQHEYLREAEADFTAAIDHILSQGGEGS